MAVGLDKVLSLAARRSSGVVVYDSATDRGFVLISLDEYERLAAGSGDIRRLTEDELLARINRDVALWREEQMLQSTATSERAEGVSSARPAAPPEPESQPIPVSRESDHYQFEPLDDSTPAQPVSPIH